MATNDSLSSDQVACWVVECQLTRDEKPHPCVDWQWWIGVRGGGGIIADREGRVTITRKLVYIRFVLYQKSARCNLRCQEEVSEQRSGNIVSVRACLMEMVRRWHQQRRCFASTRAGQERWAVLGTTLRFATTSITPTWPCRMASCSRLSPFGRFASMSESVHVTRKEEEEEEELGGRRFKSKRLWKENWEKKNRQRLIEGDRE